MGFVEKIRWTLGRGTHDGTTDGATPGGGAGGSILDGGAGACGEGEQCAEGGAEEERDTGAAALEEGPRGEGAHDVGPAPSRPHGSG